MVLKITNLHILRYLPTYWLYLLERYAIDNQRCTHTASASNINIHKNASGVANYLLFTKNSTRCCSHRRVNLAYKEKTRQNRVSEFQTMVNQ